MSNGNGKDRFDDIHQRYCFGSFVLDIDRGALLKDGLDIPLRPKTFAVLCHLVEHQGVLVTRQQLQDAVWPNLIVSDETITQSLAEIRKALDDSSRDMIRTMPRRGYLFDVPAGKEAPADASRNATPGGQPTDAAEHPGTLAGTRPGRHLIWGMLAVLTVVVAVLAIDRWAPEADKEQAATESAAPVGATDTPAWDDKSVAVLPFVNRSEFEEDSYFTDGFHDELLARLSRLSALRVISRTSVMRYVDTKKSIPEIAGELGVGTIIEGGVQRSGNQVRINVQLIDANTDQHLWAGIYDRELTAESLFAIQSEVTSAISDVLAATLSADEQQQRDAVPTQNLAALEAYFLGRQAMNRRTTASLEEAVGHLQRTIVLDPDYAEAYVALANAYHLQVFHSALPAKRQNALARPLVEKALSLDDLLGEAYITLTWWADDPAEEEALYLKGIELDPGYVEGRASYGNWLIGQRCFKEAYEQMVLAARLDPLSSPVRLGLGEALDHLGRFDEAREQYEAIIRIDPGFARAYHRLGNLEWQVFGRADKSFLWNRKAAAIDPGSPRAPANLAQLWLELGDPAEAHRWADRVRANAESEGWRNWMSWYETFHRDGPAAAVDFAAALLAAAPGHRYAIWALGLNDMATDQPDRCVERYREVAPELLDADPQPLDDTNFEVAVDLAYCLQAAGNRVQAERLLDRSLAYIQTISRFGMAGYGITDVRIFTFRGQNDQALAALREAVDSGWRLHWRMHLQHNPELAQLQSDPRFQVLIAELEADMAVQTERIRELEARGEVPPMPE